MLLSVFRRKKEPLCNILVPLSQLTACDVNGVLTQKNFLGGGLIWYLPTPAFIWMSWCLAFTHHWAVSIFFVFLRPISGPTFQHWAGLWSDITDVVVPAL